MTINPSEYCHHIRVIDHLFRQACFRPPSSTGHLEGHFRSTSSFDWHVLVRKLNIVIFSGLIGSRGRLPPRVRAITVLGCFREDRIIYMVLLGRRRKRGHEQSESQRDTYIFVPGVTQQAKQTYTHRGRQTNPKHTKTHE